MKFNSRDKDILVFLYNNRFAKTSQITELFFKKTLKGKLAKYPEIQARKRLREYEEEGIVKSFYTTLPEQVHTLDEKGVMVVASFLNTTFNKLYFNPKADLISMGIANHSILINDLYIRFLNYAEKTNGKVIEFKVEVLNRINFTFEGKNYVFQPDIYMLYQPDKNKRVANPYFIELDLDTESPKKYSEKIPVYENYYKSNEFQEQYGTFPKIITITSGNLLRIERLKRVSKTFLKWEYELMEESEKILRL